MSDIPYGGPSPFYQQIAAQFDQGEFGQLLARLNEVHTAAVAKVGATMTRELAQKEGAYKQALSELRDLIEYHTEDLSHSDYLAIDAILEGVGA